MRRGSFLLSLELFLARMAEIIRTEERTFSYLDFIFFKYKGIEYKFHHNTIRNYLSKLRKQGKIKKVGKTNPAFYTLIGEYTGKPVTLNHTGGTHTSCRALGQDVTELQIPFHNRYFDRRQGTLYSYLLRLPMDKDAIHDIRLWFKVKGLWEVIQMYSDYGYPIKSIDLQSNRDVMLEDLDYGDHIIKTTIHKTDGVSVTVACTSTPISVDLMGLIKLSTSLVRVEEKLQRIVDEYLRQNLRGYKRSSSFLTKGPIPDHRSWTVKMWHFGQDSLTCYAGEMFELSWGDALGVFHIYSKTDLANKKKVRIRKEVQESLNEPWFDVFVERVRHIDKSGWGFFSKRFNEYLGGLATV